jgi:hypothetical protein
MFGSKRISKNKINMKTVGISFLQNRVVLYFIFVIALGNMYSFLMTNDIISLVIFILSGIMTSYFSKNMAVIMCISVVITNILKYGKNAGISEGFEDDSSKTDDSVKNSDIDEGKAKADKAVTSTDSALESMTPGTSSTVDTSSDSSSATADDMALKYKELLGLQKEIVDGVQSVYSPLQKAEGIVANMKESMKNMNYNK